MVRPTRAVRESRVEAFTRNPHRAVWTLALPMMAGFLVHALYHVVDTAFIGRLGPAALAAITFVGPLFFVAIALAGGVGTGITAGIAHALGRNDQTGADRVGSNALGLMVAIGISLAVIGLLASESIIPVLGASGESAALAQQYFDLICLGLPLMFVSSTLRAVLTAEGDAKTPTVVMAIAAVTNAILDPIFIFVLEFGIAGAALATVTSQLLTFIVLGYLFFFRRWTKTRIRLSLLRPQMRLLVLILSIGLPASAGQLVMSLGRFLNNRVLAEFGEVAVAAFGAGSRVDLIVALPTLGLAGATVAVVGMFAGAGRVDLIRDIALHVYRWALLIASTLGLAAFLASRWVIGIFTHDPQTLAIGQVYLQFMVLAYPMMAIGMTSGRILQGLGFGWPSLVITVVRVLVVGVGGAYIAVYAFGAPIEAVWASIVAGGAVSNVLAVWWVRRVLWRGDPTPRAARETWVEGTADA